MLLLMKKWGFILFNLLSALQNQFLSGLWNSSHSFSSSWKDLVISGPCSNYINIIFSHMW